MKNEIIKAAISMVYGLIAAATLHHLFHPVQGIAPAMAIIVFNIVMLRLDIADIARAKGGA